MERGSEKGSAVRIEAEDGRPSLKNVTVIKEVTKEIIRAETREEIIEGIREELREEIREETREEIREETREVIREEIRGEAQARALAIKLGVEVIKEADIQMLQTMPISVGGYGIVHRALWNGVEVAVKYLAPELLYGGVENSDRHVEEFYQEAKLLSSLHHPNVVAVYGLVIPEDEDLKESTSEEKPSGPLGRPLSHLPSRRSPALVTEYISFGSLTRLLAKHSHKLSASKRVSLALSAARGMEYLHNRQIVHFDLKSDNLLIDQQPGGSLIAKVCDFGLSKQRCRTYVSGVGSEHGTVQWMAPEVVRTPERVDQSADVYSFGVVMWELWTCSLPYKHMDKLAVLAKIITGHLRPTIPGEGGTPFFEPPSPKWEDLMKRCWSQEPSLRPCFSDIANELEEMKSLIKKEAKLATE
eukprot:CAMPEP_0196588430 /NCGR_PEP_ID=MMETSP1081-20130531/60496_1 /TAXON_ID=36882 /ORGANISM="Pyramimonas amylifera, Strain CCMP720" /LENGTH=414 /DNA_ID=CAMNT_0041910921 /DNA_START=57 /DNA_END=1301 /DNA_ORIENTATION=+